MNNTGQKEGDDEGGERSSLRLAGTLVDATCFVTLLTAALFFLGYIYFACFTEATGAPYHGISLPVQEYLVASWAGVLNMLLVVGVVAFFWGKIENDLSVIRKLGAKKTLAPTDPKPRLRNPHFGTVIFVAGIVLLAGATLMRFQARLEAERVLKEAREVVIRTADGHPIDGKFVYVRNFGTVLLVREMNADFKTPLGYRWLKEGSYASYTLLDGKEASPAGSGPPSPQK